MIAFPLHSFSEAATAISGLTVTINKTDYDELCTTRHLAAVKETPNSRLLTVSLWFYFPLNRNQQF